MPDTEEIDGDVYVSPRYLAGSTAIGDPGLEPLLALGWDLHHDDLGNAYITAPDHRIRLGYLPEGDDDGLWRINAYRDRFGPPAWGVSFNDMAPTEFVTAFTTALADAYIVGPDLYLAPPDRKDPELGAFAAVVPLIRGGWHFQRPRWGVMELQPSDGLAALQYTTGRLDPEKELTTLQARWYLSGGPKSGHAHWYATASTHTPIALVKAITQSVADPAPVPRWKDGMLPWLRESAQLTPVTPPAPPLPTPLDVQRAAARRPPALGTRSVPRWSTSTPAPVRTGPRR
ncbi:DUF317 domain-containing protein [Streptomyces neyagawaensis]|uniref:DUF317 domain-containing protein n=1 Tax=Streptomyces neyagawaensis TaxID=42238 RepID=UPI0006E2C8AF|nr:DUF317 domain-containing protein [Streptomyces neyagawaensis]MCL6739437.1 DUF317 domain-containing protein [Streptomyces neyagawaensis]MDE1688347.1 DUF317 domain-containing protein [Streptomyces neyagawaensis]MDG5808511.1 DUF317 domain-containing protein [Streptomyces ossamyceticus]